MGVEPRAGKTLVRGGQLETAGLCVLVLDIEMLREGDKDGGPRSHGLETHQNVELECLGCQSNSVLILISPLEINNRLPKRSCELVPTLQQILNN